MVRRPGLKHLQLLLTPSWLSGLLDVGVVMTLFAFTVLGLHFSGSTLQKTLLTVGSSSANTYQQLTERFSDNRIITNLPLFLFWAFVGLVVYYFAMAIYNALHDAAEVKAEMDYVHISRRDLLHEAFVHLAVRAVSLALWFLYAGFFFKSLIPYALTNVHDVAVGGGSSLFSAMRLITAILIVAIGLHIHTIFLRLVVLRPRAFGATYYE